MRESLRARGSVVGLAYGESVGRDDGWLSTPVDGRCRSVVSVLCVAGVVSLRVLVARCFLDCVRQWGDASQEGERRRLT